MSGAEVDELAKAKTEIVMLKKQLQEKDKLIVQLQKYKTAWKKEGKLLLARSSGTSTSIERVPIEIWTLIFNQLKDSPRSLTACFQTCTGWENILGKDSADFLFNEVLPLLSGYLDKKDIIKCRLVSQSWKIGVENYVDVNVHNLHSSIPHQTSEFREEVKSRNSEFPFLNKFTGLNCLRPFLRYAANCPPNRNPFVTRCVTFIDDVNRYHAGLAWSVIVRTLLPQVGCHINCCEFVFAHDNKLIISWILYAALRCLPNLVSLAVTKPKPNFGGKISSGLGYPNLNLDIITASHTCPQLEYLNCLRTKDLEPEFIAELLESMPNVTKLEILHSNPSPRIPKFDLYLGSKSVILNKGNVTELYFDSLVDYFFLGRWPMEVLCFNSKISLQDLMKITIRYTDTLRVLDFSLKEVDSNGENELVPKLEFDHLQVLRGTVVWKSDVDPLLDFVLQLKSLKEFALVVECFKQPLPFQSGEDEVVKIGGYLEKMEESNIWQSLPDLELFTVKLKYKNDWTRRYTRPTQ